MSTESFESIVNAAMEKVHGNYEIKAIEVAGILGMLLGAHDREIAQARDPQRLRGTKPDTFDGAIEALREFRWQHATNDEDAIPYINAVKEMHDREIRDVSQQQYDRGYHDGQHSMDAEHRAVAMRLRHLPLDGGSHENLSQIARAVYHADFGWTQGACAALRDELVRLMGGVSDDTCGSQCRGACADSDGDDSGEQTEVTDERLADDCGADSRGGDGGGDLHMAGVRITDELRKWASDRHCKGVSHTDVLNIGLIADRIDEQFDRICAQQEAVLQATIADVVKEYEHDRLPDQLRIEKLVEQRDDLRAKLDEYDSTHVELPRDENDEVFRVDGGARVDDLVLTVRQMTLTKSGWKIRAYDENYEVEREPSFFDACAPKPDLIEETIEKLTLGEITQTEAIERIKALGQE